MPPRPAACSVQEQSVVGETPNLATRLQTLAERNAVVIAASTRRLVGDLFEYRDLGAVESLKAEAGRQIGFAPAPSPAGGFTAIRAALRIDSDQRISCSFSRRTGGYSRL